MMTDREYKKQAQLKADRKRYRDELQELSDLKEMMDMPAGKRCLQRIMRKTKPLDDSYEQTQRVAYLLGQQSVGIWLLERITAAGHKVEVSDVSNRMNMKRIEHINIALTKIDAEVK